MTENYWRVNIHEPIIWALVDFYNNLQIDRVANASNVTAVDPEIRIKYCISYLGTVVYLPVYPVHASFTTFIS